MPVGDTVTPTKECRCGQCGLVYKKLDTIEESRLFEFVEGLCPDVYEGCKKLSKCNCGGGKIVTADPPPKLHPRTNSGNSLWVKLLVQKFLQGAPTSRTLKELSLMGFSLSQGTATGGFAVINQLLEPLYEAISDHCRGADLWNADETMWRVFDGSRVKWWLWLVASGDAGTYILDETRSGEVPDEFFAGCKGRLMTDRLAAYKRLPEDIQKVCCWVHVRRDFLNEALAVPALKSWADG